MSRNHETDKRERDQRHVIVLAEFGKVQAGEERASSDCCQEQSISPGAAQFARKLVPSNIYQISGDERNEQNVGMHVTMARISCELAQWQSERAAQDRQDRYTSPRNVYSSTAAAI